MRKAILIISAVLFTVRCSLIDTLTSRSGPYWSFEAPENVDSSPAVSNGKVYVGCDDYKIYCLNANNGSKVWEYATGGEVRSSPAVFGGRVYVGSCDNTVYCLAEETGAKVWDYPTSGSILSSPAVSDGFVYIGSEDGGLYCLDANNGSKAWDFPSGESVVSTPAVSDSHVFFRSGNTMIHCLDISDGTEAWSFEAGGVGNSSPAVAGGHVYFMGKDPVDSRPIAYCLDVGTGVAKWENKLEYDYADMEYASPIIAGTSVYIVPSRFPIPGPSSLYCLDTETGIYNWVNGYLYDNPSTSPAVVGDYIIVSSSYGMIRVLDITDGTTEWMFITKDATHNLSSVAVFGEYVFVGASKSNGGAIFSFYSNSHFIIGGDSWPMFRGNPARTGAK